VAAAAALVLGFFGGRMLPRSPDGSPLLEARLAALEQEVLAARLASDDVVVRLSAIDATAATGPADPRVVDALLRTLAEDPSVNVRLAAVEALRPALAERDVALRAARLVVAEPSVLVQLALTERLVSLEDADLRRAVVRAIPRDALLPDVRRRLEELLGGNT
jgi:HEAT repeat protein